MLKKRWLFRVQGERMKKNFVYKIVARAAVVFLVLGFSIKIHAMEKNESMQQVDEHKLSDVNLSHEASEGSGNLIEPIYQALQLSQSGTVQALIRDSLRRIETGRVVTTWLKEAAFEHGDPVLLYELARCSLTSGFIDEAVIAQGLYALLLLLIRVEQDVASLNKAFSGYENTYLFESVYEKARIWIKQAHIDDRVPEALQFKAILVNVKRWFDEHTDYSNPAGVEYWKKTWGSLLGNPGVCFIDARVERREACLQESVADCINQTRIGVKTSCLGKMQRSLNWSDFFNDFNN